MCERHCVALAHFVATRNKYKVSMCERHCVALAHSVATRNKYKGKRPNPQRQYSIIRRKGHVLLGDILE